MENNWNLEDGAVTWLQKLQQDKKPVYLTDTPKLNIHNHFIPNTLLLPLIIKEKFAALLSTSFKSASRKFSPNEIALLTAFSGQISVALENAQLYRDVIKAREDLVNQEKQSLLGQIMLSLNHEINNPLSIISMEAQLLQQRISDKGDKVEARLSNIESNIERIRRILETISSLNVDSQITTDYVKGQKMLDLHNGH
ncbi:MAG: hypothetical protein GY765_03350, partial [bacterium]|nr:hypothetical protein [bacterium]